VDDKLPDKWPFATEPRPAVHAAGCTSSVSAGRPYALASLPSWRTVGSVSPASHAATDARGTPAARPASVIDKPAAFRARVSAFGSTRQGAVRMDTLNVFLPAIMTEGAGFVLRRSPRLIPGHSRRKALPAPLRRVSRDRLFPGTPRQPLPSCDSSGVRKAAITVRT